MPEPDGARVVLATRNPGKLAELRALLAEAVPGADVERLVVDAAAVGAPDVVEDGVSFEANALLKARSAAAASGLVAVADDSGLAVDVLGGAPGIFSARWAGRHGDDAANLRLLLAQLADVPDAHRGAGFVCAAALATPDGHEHVERGELRGTLLREPVGEHGFGYDPVLRPEGQQRSLAQLEQAEKNAISHRGQALRALLPHLLAVLDPVPRAAADPD
ncbi:RdgB/HAM1 family non-canonical purine NTP pyrophosphatase [Kocuria flava]|uniref:RdgB/HAM1 family non-canonical purine NTP pyrophosphatase n=1 Tax=Kocuria flava TaxID=446860 RepID=UPI001FF4A982|nr:RdgB/HAM1 family non-canonical purine NTP pyrophosphatase [Kocuria flava]MCJ8504983.1 RdgB/HAM1 family non-canonical purine NTP pyrophosphatase [Kocuria flava]